MFNQKLLSLFVCAGVASVGASPLSAYYLSAYNAQANAAGIGAALGAAFSDAIRTVTSALPGGIWKISPEQTPVDADALSIHVVPATSRPRTYHGRVSSSWDGSGFVGFFRPDYILRAKFDSPDDAPQQWDMPIADLFTDVGDASKRTWKFKGTVGPDFVFLERRECDDPPCAALHGPLFRRLERKYEVSGEISLKSRLEFPTASDAWSYRGPVASSWDGSGFVGILDEGCVIRGKFNQDNAPQEWDMPNARLLVEDVAASTKTWKFIVNLGADDVFLKSRLCGRYYCVSLDGPLSQPLQRWYELSGEISKERCWPTGKVARENLTVPGGMF